MSILLKIDTLKELCRQVCCDLKGNGHKPTAKSLQVAFDELTSQYIPEISEKSQTVILTFMKTSHSILSSPTLFTRNSQSSELNERFQKEIKRLITMFEHKEVNISQIFNEKK